jgi:hypothetical protein
VKWIARLVAIGDHIEIKIVETGKVDSPAVRQCRDPEANIERQKQYVREMAKRFGWTLQT